MSPHNAPPHFEWFCPIYVPLSGVDLGFLFMGVLRVGVDRNIVNAAASAVCGNAGV